MEVGRSIFRAIADFSGIRREARRTSRDLDKMQKIASISGNLAGSKFAGGFVKGMLKMAVVAPLVGGIGAAAVAALPAVVQLANSLAPLAGIMLPAVGVMGATVAAGAALSMGLKTMKTRLADLAPGFKAMSDSVGSNFMYYAEKPMRNMVSKLLPDLRDGMENIGSSWGQVAGEASNEMTRMLGNGQLKYMLEETRKGVHGLIPAMKPLISGFTFLGMAGVKYTSRMSAGVVTMSQKFDAWAQKIVGDGSFDRWVENAIAGFKDLWSILKSVGGIFGAINKAADAAGGSTTLHGLAVALERISAIMNAPGFQTALTTIFKGANAGASALLDSLGPVGAAFERGAPALAKFFELGGQILGLIIGGLADAISNPAFGAGLIAFMEGVKIGATALAPILPVLSTLLGAILTALAPVIAMLGPSLGATLVVIGTAFAGIVAAASPFLTILAAMLPVLIPLGLTLMAVYKGMMLFQQIKTIIAIVKSLTAAQWLWNIAMSANPIGIVIALIALLVAGLIWFFTQTDLGREMWANFCRFLSEAAANVVAWLQANWPLLLAILLGPFGLFIGFLIQHWDQIMAFLGTVFGIIGGMFSSWGASISAMWTTLWSSVMMFISQVWGAIQGIFATAWAALVALCQGRIAEALGLFMAMGAQIQALFANAGSWLMDAGIRIVQGLIDGISSMIGAAGNAIGGVMDAIGQFLPHSPAKKGEFSGKGWTPFRGKSLVKGFAAGIEEGTPVATSAAGSSMAKVSGALNAGAGLNVNGALGGPGSGPSLPPFSPSAPPPPAPAPEGGGRNLSVTINNPEKETPSRSIEKTYSKIAYLGLDGKEPVGV